ncbi:TPA: hypothetical protein LNJ17_002954 [Vibrio cholerae]|nr:hypothetical protein [Vibrio cholerae]
MDASIEKRPRTRLSPQKRKLQLMEIALEVFAKRGIGRGGHADPVWRFIKNTGTAHFRDL